MTNPSSEKILLSQLKKIKEDSSIGRSSNLSKLLEYLVRKEINKIAHEPNTSHAPKELEIAMEVFGKTADFNSSEDSSVRVHMSRLRKKLDEHYLNNGKNNVLRIAIPIGEYRLEIIQNTNSETNPITHQSNEITSPDKVNKSYFNKGVICICLLTLIMHLAINHHESSVQENVPSSQLSPIWYDYSHPKHRNLIVLGESFESDDVNNINSKRISKSHLLSFKNILSISNNFRFTHVIYASELTVKDIKQANIVYIGHFEDMNILSNYFNASQFSYDAESRSLKVKNSEVSYLAPKEGKDTYNDYGLFAKVDGPRNNKIYIITGHTDSSLLWLTWFLTSDNESANKDFGHSIIEYQINKGENFELLFKIPSIKGHDMGHELISSSVIKSTIIWNGY